MTTILRPLPNIKRFTLGNIDVLTKVDFPLGTGKVTVKFITNDGKISFDGTAGGSVGTNYLSIVADVFFEINWVPLDIKNTARTHLFLSGDINSTDVEVLVEE